MTTPDYSNVGRRLENEEWPEDYEKFMEEEEQAKNEIPLTVREGCGPWGLDEGDVIFTLFESGCPRCYAEGVGARVKTTEEGPRDEIENPTWFQMECPNGHKYFLERTEYGDWAVG